MTNPNGAERTQCPRCGCKRVVSELSSIAKEPIVVCASCGLVVARWEVYALEVEAWKEYNGDFKW